MRAKPKGPWFQRFLISFFTVVLAVLVFWVLGFLMEDIESIEGPRYRDIEEQYVDRGLVEKSKQLAEEIAGTDREIDAKREEMRIVSDSSLNLQGTINQLIELQKLTIQKSLSLPEAHSSNLSESLAGFLESQKLYQAHSAELSRLAERKRALESERLKLEKTIEEQRKPAGKSTNGWTRSTISGWPHSSSESCYPCWPQESGWLRKRGGASISLSFLPSAARCL